jgi:hypothetical protein
MEDLAVPADIDSPPISGKLILSDIDRQTTMLAIEILVFFFVLCISHVPEIISVV